MNAVHLSEPRGVVSWVMGLNGGLQRWKDWRRIQDGKLEWKLGIRNLGWLGSYAPRWTLSCMTEPAVHFSEPRGVALPGMEGDRRIR